MKIIIDTNVLISGIFFGGFPRMVIDAVYKDKFEAYASLEIISEYQRVVQEMIARKNGSLNNNLLVPLIEKMIIIEPISKTDICRDPDDNKFLNCAKDAEALYIVSGDDDLLVLKQYGITQIITAKMFCEKFL